MSDFDRSMPKLLVHEGGKVDDKRDPGGRTNQGVTQRVYDAYRRRKGQPTRDVYQMTATERDEIYRTSYWNPIKGDQLPPGVNYVIFDGAVNSGVSQSVKWAQRALGARYSGKIDGVLGEQTLDAIDSHPDHDKLVADIIARREAFLRALKTFKTFGKGWMHRISDVRAVGQAWAMGSVGPEVTYAPGAHAKANIEDAKKPPARALADVATGLGVSTGGGAQALDGSLLDKAKETLAPLAGNVWADNVLTSITVAGVLITVGGVLYRIWAANKAKKLADALDQAVPA